MTTNKILESLKIMAKQVVDMPPTLSELVIKEYGKDPYLILISCLLSLRSRDPVTYLVVKDLFSRVKTPIQMLKLDINELEKIIYPIGFYKRKSQILKSVSKELIERFNSQVPKTEKELLSIKGIGRKTANLVLNQAFDVPTIIVDTHVHRISNHLGWVKTKTPDQTEEALKKIIPQKLWSQVNNILVKWGQNICKPNIKACECRQLLDAKSRY